MKEQNGRNVQERCAQKEKGRGQLLQCPRPVTELGSFNREGIALLHHGYGRAASGGGETFRSLRVQVSPLMYMCLKHLRWPLFEVRSERGRVREIP